MKFAYLVVAHKSPEQFIRLIKKIDSPDSVFFIHIDKKADFDQFKKVADFVTAEKIIWLKRKSIIWAGFNMIRVTLDGMREVLKSGYTFSHISLLSGQDYPIKPIAAYHRFLTDNPGKDFIETSKMPRPNWQSGGLDRIQYYHLIFPKFRIAFPLLSYLNVKLRYREGGKWDIFKKIVSFFPKRKDFPRKFLDNTTPYDGSQWWTISIGSASRMIEFLKNDKKFYNYFKYTHVADEIFFPTFIMNKDINDKKNIINDNLRHITWSEYTGHPDVFEAEDYDKLIKSPAYFARKFDAGADSVILNMLDKHIGQP